MTPTKLWKYRVVRERPAAYEPSTPQTFMSAKDVVERFAPWYETQHQEVPVAIWLNNKHRLVGWHVISIGTANTSIVHPADTYRALILGGAVCWIFAHNHPSGDVIPSREDREMTRRLKELGELHAIPLLDSIIVGSATVWYSAADAGHL